MTTFMAKKLVEINSERLAPFLKIKDFCPHTIEKDLVENGKQLKKLGFSITHHDKMPDVVHYC